MFDFFPQCTQYARFVAWSHPKTLATWPDGIRRHHDDDTDTLVSGTLTEKPTVFVRYRLVSGRPALRLNLQCSPARRIWAKTYCLLVKRHSATNQ